MKSTRSNMEDLFHKIQSIIDANTSNILEGDYLELCNTIGELWNLSSPSPFETQLDEQETLAHYPAEQRAQIKDLLARVEERVIARTIEELWHLLSRSAFDTQLYEQETLAHYPAEQRELIEDLLARAEEWDLACAPPPPSGNEWGARVPSRALWHALEHVYTSEGQHRPSP